LEECFWCCYRYVFFIKKNTLYLHISVTIPLLWESEERDYESSGRCRVQGRVYVSADCVLVCTNVKQLIRFQYMIIYRRGCEIALTVYWKTSVLQISPTTQENGRHEIGPQLVVSPNRREVPHFLLLYIYPVLSVTLYPKENQKRDKKKINSAIFTLLTL